MPSVAFWFACLYAFITASTGALLTALTQASGTVEPISRNTWLVILASGLSSAAVAGKAAWKTIA